MSRECASSRPLMSSRDVCTMTVACAIESTDARTRSSRCAFRSSVSSRRAFSSIVTVSGRAALRCASCAVVRGTWLPTTTRPPRSCANSIWSGKTGSATGCPMCARRYGGPMRSSADRPSASSAWMASAMTRMSSSATTSGATTDPAGASRSTAATASGPFRTVSMSISTTWSAAIRPPVFSAT